jgi:hypothetical protein
MGREEEREILAGLKPERVPQVDLDRATDSSAEQIDVPEPDRRGLGEDDGRSAFERGDPDAVPADVTDEPEYAEELAEVRRQARAGEAVVEDGRNTMPPTRYERG